MKPMDPTSRMQSRNRAILRTSFKPGRARAGPGCSGHECDDVFREVVDCGGEGTDGDDIFKLAFLDYFCDVFCEVLGDC